MKIKYLFLTFFLFFFTSCMYYSIMRLKNATEPPIENYESDTKKVRFIGIVHLAKPVLYERIKTELKAVKEEGYVLFWEFIDFKNSDDTELRKIRKMMGFIPSKEGYEKQNKEDLEKGYVTQENEMFLGLVNNKDFNVDITPTDIVQAYEKKFGEIVLEQIDLDTPLDEKITDTLSAFDVLDIVLNHRNNYLASEIQKSKFDKIVVLYGALHQKGLLKDLQKLDESWEKR